MSPSALCCIRDRPKGQQQVGDFVGPAAASETMQVSSRGSWHNTLAFVFDFVSSQRVFFHRDTAPTHL